MVPDQNIVPKMNEYLPPEIRVIGESSAELFANFNFLYSRHCIALKQKGFTHSKYTFYGFLFFPVSTLA